MHVLVVKSHAHIASEKTRDKRAHVAQTHTSCMQSFIQSAVSYTYLFHSFHVIYYAQQQKRGKRNAFMVRLKLFTNILPFFRKHTALNAFCFHFFSSFKGESSTHAMQIYHFVHLFFFFFYLNGKRECLYAMITMIWVPLCQTHVKLQMH